MTPCPLPRTRLLAAATLVVVSTSCADRAPSELGLPFPATLAVAPSMAVVGGPSFDLVGVRVTLSEIPPNTPVLDTTVAFTAGDSTLQLALTVRLLRPFQSYLLRVAAMDVLGDTLFRSADTVTLRQNETHRMSATELRYSGPDTLVAGLTIAPRDTLVTVGIPISMRAVAYDSTQRVLELARVGWRSRDTSSIQIAADGTLLALRPAQAVWIVARTANGHADSTLVSAELPRSVAVASVDIEPILVSLFPGDTLLLSATPRDSQGAVLDTPVTWSVLDTILTIDPRGLLTALGAGLGRVVATSDKVSDTATVTVLNATALALP